MIAAPRSLWYALPSRAAARGGAFPRIRRAIRPKPARASRGRAPARAQGRSEKKTPVRLRTLWLIVVFLLIGTGLRTWQIDTQSIWFDEGFSWHAATRPDLVSTLNGDPTNPPLYYLLLHSWVRLTGDSEFALRALSLLQGVILMSLMGLAARRWFGRRAGVPAVALGAFAPLLWWASQEARMYNTLAIAVLLAALGLAEIAAGHRTRWAWAILLLGELAALYSHNTGVVVLGALNLAFAVLWTYQTVWTRRGDWKLPGAWFVGQAVVAILWLPELTARFSHVSAANVGSASPPTLTLSLLWQSWQALWASSWEMVLEAPPNLHLATIAMLPLAALGLASLKARPGRILVVLIAALYAFLIGALIVLGVNFHGRYLVMATPLLFIAMAGGIVTLSHRGPLTAGLAAVAITMAGGAWLIADRSNPLYQHDQAREMVRYYRDTLEAGDLVLTWSYAERYDLAYYWDRLGVRADLVTLPDGSDAATVTALINAHLLSEQPVRAEVNTWYTQASDRRGLLRCLIGHGQPAPTETFTTYGMSTTGYRLQGPLENRAIQPIAPIRFGPLQLEGVSIPPEALAADAGLCLPLEVRILAPGEDVQAAVNALNDLGWEIAGSDAPLLSNAQTPVSRLEPGAVVQAYPLLYLPPGAPPGSYPLRARLYSQASPSGLDVLDPASLAPAGKDAAIGIMQARRGDWPAFAGSCLVPVTETVILADCAGLPTGPILSAGEAIPLTLYWQIERAPPAITVSISGDGWRVQDTARPGATGGVLDWRALLLPADAAGTATLSARVGNEGASVTLAEYRIQPPEHRMTRPDIGQETAAEFPGIGTLVGFSVDSNVFTNGEPVGITLVWRAEAGTSIPYTVSVQIIDAQGRLLAQHDSAPDSGERPTTGWVSGEYISDSHMMTFREGTEAYEGPASLLVVLYDPATFNRALTAKGEDHAVLSEVTITGATAR